MGKLYIEKNYGIAPNKLLNSEELTFKAKGLFTFLQAKPDGWKFSVNRIKQQSKDGKDSVNAGLKELEKNGYLKRKAIKNKDGKWDGYDYFLTENPFTENPSTDKPSTENRATLSNKDISNKDNSKKEIEAVFNFWNDQKIIKHSKLTEKIKTKIKSALKDYNKEEIFLAIKKYKMVLDGPEYFWTYQWTLPDFLQRGLTKFHDTPIDNFKKNNGFEKPKKKQMYFNGNPVFEKQNGRKFVISNGEWLEFAGDEKDIEVKYE